MINRYAQSREGNLKVNIFSETKMINRYALVQEVHLKRKI